MRRDVKAIQAAILMLAIGCGGTSSPTPTPTPTPTPAPVHGGDPSPKTVPGPVGEGWQAYSPPEGDYIVSLPPGVAAPKQTKEVDPSEGGSIITRAGTTKLAPVTKKMPEGILLNLSVTNYPKAQTKGSTPEQWLAKTGKQFAAGFKVSPKSTKSLRVGGHPAHILEFNIPPGEDGPMDMRILHCWANDSLYQVMVVGPPGTISGDQFTKVLDSFKLASGATVPKPADGPLTKGSPAGDTLSAVALSQEFKEDFKAAGKRRLGKMVTVEGVVGELLPAKPGGGPTLILQGYEAPGEPPGKRRVRCTFSAKSTDLPQVQNLKRGEKVTIRGQLSAGGPNFVTLQQSTLVTGSAGSDR